MMNDTFILIERLANLLRNEARIAGQAYDLQPVQHDALHYLSVCNRYSDTPLAVTEYLGLTKGTVSQTLKILENRGLLSKQKDSEDKRVTHLALTNAGKEYIQQAFPPRDFMKSMESFPNEQKESLQNQLKQLLTTYQNTSGRTGFGICQHCLHNQSHDGQFICGLTKETLSLEDIDLICREFEEKV
jgi:DNA-binding MarR family transcriptional regulator